MKIIQITDLHIGMADEDTHGVDVQANFSAILQAIRQLDFDQLIITGDLCLLEGRADTYQWIADQLIDFPKPVHFLSGNHDHQELMARHLNVQGWLKKGELYGNLKIGEEEVICLDTSPGTMSAAQKLWLGEQVINSIHPRLIFMHHPPAKAGLPFMDKNYPFREMEELQAIFSRSPQRLSIFCGHYHTECYIQVPQGQVFITPSTYVQISRTAEVFQVEHSRIAYRWIEVDEAHQVRTGVNYLEGHRH